MPAAHAASLVNLTGFIAGTVLYAMLLAMVVRSRAPARETGGADRVLVLTALLGLAWNIEAFVSNGLTDFGISPLRPIVQAGAAAALGFLPALMVHSVLRTALARVTSPAALAQVVSAYALSGAAAVIQVGGAVQDGTVPTPLAWRLLTIGYGALMVSLALSTRGQPGARRALWMTALAIFTASALHLSQRERPQPTWTGELLGHHASLPIALAVLYQEYPFALADVFLKRALALLTLIVAALVAYVSIETSGLLAATRPGGSNVPALVFFIVSVWAALLYPALMRLSNWFVDTVVLRRVDYEQLRGRLARALVRAATPTAALQAVAETVAPALSAADVTWREDPRQTDTEGLAVVSVPSRGLNAEVVVPTTDTPRYVLSVSGLRGGRRLLSDDVAMLESAAQLLARRIDALRIEKERSERTLREEAMRRMASEAELRALRAQINPHFLFNALTTVGHLIETAPERAMATLLRLTELLRRVLRSDASTSTLGSELSLVLAYLDIEQARFEERLSVEIDVPSDLHAALLPPLVVQPLVENAIKHGIAPFRRKGRLSLHARVEGEGDAETLVVTVRDSGSGIRDAVGRSAEPGVGLQNVIDRLSHAYGPRGTLSLTPVPGTGTTAELRIPFVLAPERVKTGAEGARR